MLKFSQKFIIFCFVLYSIIVSRAIRAEQDKVNIMIQEPDIKDKKLSKTLDTHKKILQEKTKLKLVTHRKSYLESEGKLYLLKLLKSLGYYSGEVEIIENEQDKENNIIFNILPGPLYIMSTINISITKDSYTLRPQLKLPPQEWYELRQGNGAIAKSILLEEKRLQGYIENNNYLLSIEVNHEAIVNKQNHTVDIIYNIVTGPLAHINKVTFKGLSAINEKYARKLVLLKDGEGFKIPNVNEAKNVLQRSGLFINVEPIIPEVPPGKEGGIELQFKVKERQHRSIKVGVNYSSDLRPGVAAGWEHRNLFSQGEKITSTVSVTKKEQELDNKFEKPFFISDTQTLKINNNIAKKGTLAYLDEEASISAILERKFSFRWIGGVGAKYIFNRIEDTKKVVKDFGLLSTLIYGIYDSRDNILNATKGVYAKLEVSSFFDTINLNDKFIKEVISASTYLAVESTLEPILAIRGAYGVISGINIIDNIPATERFYAGGSRSIRGYGYQLVGPLNKKNDPIGGQSFVETSIELRLHINEYIGGVVFVDGGNVFSSKYGKINNKNLVFGAGVGIRYYTDFAPLRVDVAFPITKKRHKIDKAFQVYFSIGQEF